MKRAFSKPTSGEAEFATLMTEFHDAGFEGLQLKMGQFGAWLDDPDSYLDLWGDDPTRVSALISFSRLDPQGMAHLETTIRFAAAVGAERVVFCHDRARLGLTASDIADIARSLRPLAQQASDSGIALSLHHHFNQPVMHYDDFSAFFEAVEPGTIGLTIDTAHLAKSGIDDLPGFVRDFAGIIDNVHLKDFAEGEWRLLGEGVLDLRGVVAALKNASYDGWLCADEETSASLATGFRASSAWLDKNLP